MERITKKEIDALLDEIDSRAAAAEKRKAAFQVAVRNGMEAAGLKYMVADEPDSPELNASPHGTLSAWLDAEREAGLAPDAANRLYTAAGPQGPRVKSQDLVGSALPG